MRIGILTYHCVPNFGAQLQAVSTVGFLRKNGHEPVVLNWYPHQLENMYSQRVPSIQLACHWHFTDKMLPVSRICRTINDLVNEIDSLNLQGIIVGSDALFKYTPVSVRKNFFRRILSLLGKRSYWDVLEENPFFGGFAFMLKKRIPVCAFSVSSQNCPYADLNSSEIQQLKKNLEAFSYITVRDEWTSLFVKYINGGNEIPITPDPVFAFNQNLYVPLPAKSEILERFGLPENYVLLSFSKNYVRDDYVHELAQELKKVDYCPVAFPMPEGLRDFNLDKKVGLPLSPLDWYALIKYSKGYVGERMHPIVVALHNATPFFCFDEYGTYKKNYLGMKIGYVQESSKTYLILKKAGLLKYMYSYHTKEGYPQVKMVVEGLKSFDMARCSDFSANFQSNYNRSMEKIIGIIRED